MSIRGLLNDNISIDRSLRFSLSSPLEWLLDEPWLELPDGSKIIGAMDIMYHFEKQMTSAVTSNWAQCMAYYSLLKERLVPALVRIIKVIKFELYKEFWLNPENYLNSTSKEYSRAVGFPLNLVYCGMKRKRILKSLTFELKKGEEEIKQSDEVLILGRAKEFLNILERKLNDKEYFFGDKPSSLDAIVYGHLAMLQNAKLVIIPLLNHLKSCPSLLAHCQRMETLVNANKFTKVDTNESREKAAIDKEFPNRIRNIILTAVFGISTLLLYTISTGIIQINVNQDDISDNETEEEQLED
ncbi:DgyrCDS5647 [Dimorphilus gyrociliatus]|uniref:DgyrCDS5647 n=1 Tax=Dimorphilus gyrociliatus TaxID=2664684 RepID=A0A7I8VKJ0_9ANNE|nr:DgyrCDS5647 [Dimorphilus gyrociliatus]